jgi:hypothetical protein
MAQVAKRKLSSSTSGRNIKVAATATPGTAVHTATTSTTDGTYDEVWLWAYNSDTVPRALTIEFGGTTSPDDLIKVTLPAASGGLVTIVPGMVLQNGLTIRAFAAAANVVVVNGYVNAISA